MSNYKNIEIITGGDQGNRFTPKELLVKYVAFLPLFIISIILCVSIATIYVRYVTPKYVANTLMFIKEEKGSGGQGDVLEKAILNKSSINIENEMQLIRSMRLFERVVVKNGFNTLYYNEGNVRKTEMYGDFGFHVNFANVLDSSVAKLINIKELNKQTLLVSVDGKKNYKTIVWNQIVRANGFDFQFVLDGEPKVEKSIIVKWLPTSWVAGSFISGFNVRPINNKATILNLSITTENPDKAAAILNALIETYVQQNVDDKNKIAINTIKFIDARLGLVDSGLSGVEAQMSSYQKQNQVFDPKSQANQYFGDTKASEKTIREQVLKTQLVGMLKNFVQNPANKYKLVPSALATEDPTLSALIVAYNQALLKRDREIKNIPESNPIAVDMNNQIESMRQDMLFSINTLLNTQELVRTNIDAQSGMMRSALQQMPEKERKLLSIKRQQGIKETLYLYLLQKREESAISLASTLSRYEQIDKATANFTPIEPNPSKAKSYAFVIALLISIGIIYLRDMMNDKITTREDIAKISQVPIIGEIGHADDAPGTIVVNKSRDVIAEQFRIIRTNLQYLIGNQDKYTILVTSSISGEGKSFASSNLAVVIAMLGKRVALLEFDLRKPKIVKELGLPKAAIGITNVLMGNASLDQIKIPYPSITNLDIIPSGPTPPNPAEIIMLPSLNKMMEQLKTDYDVVIIDSAPVGLVSDSFSLSQKADAVLYVVRQRYTFKKQMHFVDEIYTQSKLGKMGILVNDVKVGGSHGYYGYGYGYGGHGYSYGYGYFDDKKQKNIFAKIISYFKGNQV